jgi:hypothetical protein
MMAMPEPSEHHRRLHRFAGTWFGEEHLSPSPWGPGGMALGRSTYRVDVGGFFLIQDYIEERDGRIVFRGHGIMGWDDATKEYLWYWVDSLGSIPQSPSRGIWEGETLIFEHDTNEGQRGRHTFHFIDEDSLATKIENSEDGGHTWLLFMEATYQRH